MREVIITQILYIFDQKNRIFVGWSWLKFNNLGLVLGHFTAVLQQYGKKIKTEIEKVLRKTSKGPFCTFPSSHPE